MFSSLLIITNNFKKLEKSYQRLFKQNREGAMEKQNVDCIFHGSPYYLLPSENGPYLLC